MTIIKSENISVMLSGVPEPQRDYGSDGRMVYRQEADEGQIVETYIEIHGSGEIHWPNREGEKFHLSDVHQNLARYGRARSGLSLCWPATSSVQGVGIRDVDDFYTFSAEPDLRGKVRNLSISSYESDTLRFTFTGSSATWKLCRENHSKTSGKSETVRTVGSLYQIGLTGPDGNSEIPQDRGFDVLSEAGKALIDRFGTPEPGDIIHIFAYGEGHDLGYPDYAPSERLGGPEAFSVAITRLREMGFEISLYVNARLAELSRLKNYPALSTSVLTDSNGDPVIEIYRGRNFAVMNPLSKPWIDHLLEQITRLKGFGAEWIQLDQVAGRSAPVTAGEVWGEGYQKLIDEIHRLGMKVWIQGVSDFYNADAFEATWRPLNILEDGTLRHGWPLGEPDTSLIETTGFNKILIVPEKKRIPLKKSRLPLIHDRLCVDDVLPLWGESWIRNLKSNNYSRVPGELNGGII